MKANKPWCRSLGLWVASALCAGCAPALSAKMAEEWTPVESPAKFPGARTDAFDALPLAGMLDRIPWGGWSWKTYAGGTAFRWRTGEKVWDYSPPSREAAFAMSEERRALLSPAEKYDLFAGQYEFPTVKAERERSSPQAPSWSGLCHGWAASALLLREPGPVTLTNAQGLSIPFGSADVKAILAYFVGDVLRAQMYVAGSRCESNGSGGAECRDLNAGAFHLILTNRVGLQKRGVIIDSEQGRVVWNRPIAGYETRVLGRRAGASPGAAPQTREEVTVETRLVLGVRADPHWDVEPVGRTEAEAYRYRLELDESGRVVGGSWISAEHPDYAWMRDEDVFRGAPPELVRLYKASAGEGVPEASAESRVCPAGTWLEVNPEAPEAPYCARGQVAVGPITPAMRTFCLEKQDESVCRAAEWPKEIYREIRGGERCPPGTEHDDVIDACTDFQFAYGPFLPDQVADCRAGGARFSCEAVAWSRSEAERLLRR